LEASDYDTLAGKRPQREDYLFSYMLHGLETDAAAQVQSVSRVLRIQKLQCDACKTSLFHGYTLPTPAGWLSWVRHASFVVTNSFHGVMFSLIFNVPFVAILIHGKKGSMNARISDVLERVGLSHRVFEPGEEVGRAMLDEKIDWASVNRALAAFRAESIAYLEGQRL
jgi:hypothetical protein